jgi:hypothetical protein
MRKRLIFGLLIALVFSTFAQVATISTGDAAPEKMCCYTVYYEPGVPTVICFPPLPDGSCPDLPPLM